MPSMCLARRLKQRYPRMKVLVGGAAAEGPMGLELLRLFPEIDYVFLGEADESFPDLAEQLLAAGPVRLPPGVAGRASADTRAIAVGEDPKSFVDLNSLAYPDFDDYLRPASPQSAGRPDRSALLFRDVARLLVGAKAPLCVLRAERRPPDVPRQAARPGTGRDPLPGPASRPRIRRVRPTIFWITATSIRFCRCFARRAWTCSSSTS